MKKLRIKLNNRDKTSGNRPQVSGEDIFIFDSHDQGMIIRKARPIEHYFNTLPPLDVDFKDKISLAFIDCNW